MNADRNNKRLDELISKAIGRDKPQFNFNRWKQEHEKEIDIFESQEKSKRTTPATSVAQEHGYRTTGGRRARGRNRTE
jgi:hypothetical protein